VRYERLTRYEPGFHGRFTGVNAAFSRIWLSRRRDALQLYEGELMPGFVVPGCADLNFWLDERRAALRERAAATARALACRLERRTRVSRKPRDGRVEPYAIPVPTGACFVMPSACSIGSAIAPALYKGMTSSLGASVKHSMSSHPPRPWR